LKHFALLTIDEEVIASAIDGLESDLRSDASEDAISHNADSVAEDICFLHRMGRQDDRSLSFLGAQDIPQLSSVLRVKSRGWLIQVDNLRLTNH